MSQNNFEGWKIDIKNQFNLHENAKQSICPLCSHDRKKKTDKCAKLDWQTGLGTCYHCGETFQLHTYKRESNNEIREYKKPEWVNKTDIPDSVIKFFEERSISQSTVKKFKIGYGKEYMPQFRDKKAGVNTIQFPYMRFGECVNIKFRGPKLGNKKTFKLASGAELIPFNLDAIIHEDECYIVEGEPDCMAVDECGISNVCSVPNGANLNTCNLEWLDNTYEHFKNKKKIILCVDDDEAGNNLKNELVRRLGSEICYFVNLYGEKDANDFLKAKGKVLLKEALENYKPIPITNVSTVKDHEDDLFDFIVNGDKAGFKTGMENLDSIYATDLSQYTMTTGVPQSGKSEFIDFKNIKYALRYGWKMAICSVENKPNKYHSRKIIEKIYGRPITKEDRNTKTYKDTINWMHDHIKYIDFDRYELEETLNKCRELVSRWGIKMIVLDPYNKVKLKRAKNSSLVEYTEEYHAVLDEFCKKNDVCIDLVAHPVKMEKDAAGAWKVPSMYDIKGGGEHFDMSYHGLVVHRYDELGYVMVKTLKVKFKHLGEANKTAWFKYDRNSGRYFEVEGNPIDDLNSCKVTYDTNHWISNEENIREDLENQPTFLVNDHKLDLIKSRFKENTPKDDWDLLSNHNFDEQAPF